MSSLVVIFSCPFIAFGQYSPQDCRAFLGAHIDDGVTTPIQVTDCASGYFDGVVLEEGEITPLILCNENHTPLMQFHWDATEQYYAGSDHPCDRMPIPVCARLVIYRTDRFGNNLTQNPSYVGRTYEYWTDCRSLCNIAEVHLNLKTFPPNGLYAIELQMACCPTLGLTQPTVFHTIKRARFHASTAPELPDVDFDFIASQIIDQINNQGDSPIDGLEPRSTTLPGPEVGSVSIGVDASIIGGSFLEEITYTVEEVDCSNGQNGTTIFELSAELEEGIQPENFLFLDHFLDPVTGNPWFFEDANTIGKCFKLTVAVRNPCGSISNFSFFTISEVLQFCSVPGEGGLRPAISDQAVLHDELNNEEGQAMFQRSETSLDVFPNPTSGRFNLITNNNEIAIVVSIRNSNGQLMDEFELLPSSRMEYDLGQHPSGVYFIHYQDAEGKKHVQKIIKL